MEAIRPLSRRALTPLVWVLLVVSVLALGLAPAAQAQTPAPAAAVAAPAHSGGEASLKLPDLAQASFVGMTGRTMLQWGLLICLLGLAFGLVIYAQLKNLPVHQSMREISELIYETCKTYLITQGKFLMILELFIAVIIVFYFGILQHFEAVKVIIILLFSVVGILGSYGVAWFGIRINTFANSRTAFASLAGKPYPVYAIPLKAGMSIGMLLVSVELFIMLCILLYIPGDYAGACFIGFAIGESLGAAALRIAGGIFTKIADIGSDLMKIVFNIKEDDARNPGVIADCTGDNAGDSVGPTADGFETYGVTGVALITFILLAVPEELVQVQLLVWIFVMRIMMILASGGSYLVNEAFAKARYGSADQDELRGASDEPGVAHLHRVGGADLRRVLDHDPGPRRRQPVVEALDGHHLRHAGRRHHSGVRQGVHLHQLGPRARGRHLGPRGRGVAQHPLRPRGGQLQRLLAGPDHGAADEHRLRGQHAGARRPDGRARGVRVRPRGLRLPGHGPGDHRGGLLRPGHRQRAVGVRAVGDRDDARHQAESSRRTTASTSTSRRPSTSWRRTTARATPSRRPPSRC